jgi:hypothetical protein
VSRCDPQNPYSFASCVGLTRSLLKLNFCGNFLRVVPGGQKCTILPQAMFFVDLTA